MVLTIRIELIVMKTEKSKGRLFLLTSFAILVFCVLRMDSTESSFSSTQRRNLEAAKKIEDIFKIETQTQLATSPDFAIADITDMEVDSEGNYIVADGWLRKAIFIFASDGRFLKQLGRQGQGPGEYQTPVSVDISSKREIWVGDYLGNRINVYDENFEFKRSIVGKGKIFHFIHINSQDEIYMYSGSVNPFRPAVYDTIQKYDSQGNRIISFAPLPEEIMDVKFSAIQDGMTLDRDDFIYEMNPLLYSMRKFTPNGKLVTTFSRKTGFFKIITKEGERPIVVYGPYYLEKGLILARVSDNLEIYDTDGNFIVGGLPFPHEIVATRGNSLYAEKWEETDRPEEQPNPKIICYKLKIS